VCAVFDLIVRPVFIVLVGVTTMTRNQTQTAVDGAAKFEQPTHGHTKTKTIPNQYPNGREGVQDVELRKTEMNDSNPPTA
jgi:hypothetical protein